MRILAILIVVVLLVVGVWFGFTHQKENKNQPKPLPIAVSQHSDTFNTNVNKVMASYAALTEDFINWDSAAAAKEASILGQNLNNMNFNELKKDTVIYQTATSYLDNFKTDIRTMETAPGIVKKREAFNSLSQNLYDLLRTIHYDGSKMYLQECPMAFNNETTPGTWLSPNAAIRNPYMGLHHPKYGKAMMTCGNTKDSINFVAAKAQ